MEVFIGGVVGGIMGYCLGKFFASLYSSLAYAYYLRKKRKDDLVWREENFDRIKKTIIELRGNVSDRESKLRTIDKNTGRGITLRLRRRNVFESLKQARRNLNNFMFSAIRDDHGVGYIDKLF